MLRLLLLSGFNPFGLESWGIDKFYTEGCAPEKRNWTVKDLNYVLDNYTAQYGQDPYILSCHSDGGTIAHIVAHYDTRCVGLHCHAAVFNKPFRVRKIPVLLTNNKYDLTGMGFCSLAARSFYRSNLSEVEYFRLPRGGTGLSSWFGHNYDNCISTFRVWCLQRFNYEVPIA